MRFAKLRRLARHLSTQSHKLVFGVYEVGFDELINVDTVLIPHDDAEAVEQFLSGAKGVDLFTASAKYRA
jgi:hypothetical protein